MYATTIDALEGDELSEEVAIVLGWRIQFNPDGAYFGWIDPNGKPHGHQKFITFEDAAKDSPYPDYANDLNAAFSLLTAYVQIESGRNHDDNQVWHCRLTLNAIGVHSSPASAISRAWLKDELL